MPDFVQNMHVEYPFASKRKEKGRGLCRLQVVWGEGRVQNLKVRTKEVEGDKTQLVNRS
jgi:hypothetical protein